MNNNNFNAKNHYLVTDNEGSAIFEDNHVLLQNKEGKLFALVVVQRVAIGCLFNLFNDHSTADPGWTYPLLIDVVFHPQAQKCRRDVSVEIVLSESCSK